MKYFVRVEDDGTAFIWKSKDVPLYNTLLYFSRLEDLKSELHEYGHGPKAIENAISVMLGINNEVQV